LNPCIQSKTNWAMGSFLVEFMYALIKHLAKVACP